MAVAFDNKVEADTGATNVATLTTGSFVIGSGSNRFAVAVLVFGGALPSGISGSISGGGGNFVAIVGASGAATSSSAIAYGLVAPGSGTKTVSFSWTGNKTCYLAVITGTGADQTGGTTTFPHGNFASGTSAAPAIAITSATNNGVFGAVGSVSGFTSTSDSSWYNDSVGLDINSAGNYLIPTNASSHTLSAVLSPSDNWAYAGGDILAASASSASVTSAPRQIGVPGMGPRRFPSLAYPAGSIDTPLTAAFGSYALSGKTATFDEGMPAVFGSYVLTGQITTFNLGTIASFGSYTLTGEATTFDDGLTAAFGSYVLNGQVATFLTGTFVTAAFGSYTLNGQATTDDTSVPAAFGPYSLAGKTTAPDIGMPSVSGSYILIGETATADVGLLASNGSYTLSGSDVTFTGGVSSTLASWIIYARRRRSR